MPFKGTNENILMCTVTLRRIVLKLAHTFKSKEQLEKAVCDVWNHADLDNDVGLFIT